MFLLEDIFDASGKAKAINTLYLCFGYHQLPLKEGHKVKIIFWKINFPKKYFILMKVFAIWFEEHPCKISEDHESNVVEFWFCQMLY
jgi:hypothetical protein